MVYEEALVFAHHEDIRKVAATEPADADFVVVLADLMDPKAIQVVGMLGLPAGVVNHMVNEAIRLKSLPAALNTFPSSEVLAILNEASPNVAKLIATSATAGWIRVVVFAMGGVSLLMLNLADGKVSQGVMA